VKSKANWGTLGGKLIYQRKGRKRNAGLLRWGCSREMGGGDVKKKKGRTVNNRIDWSRKSRDNTRLDD